MQGNAMISMLLLQIPLFVGIFGLISLDWSGFTPEMLRIVLFGVLFGINLGISIPLFYVGMKKLTAME